RHEKKDDAIGPCREVWHLRRERAGGRGCGPRFPGEECAEREGPEPGTGVPEELTPGEGRGLCRSRHWITPRTGTRSCRGSAGSSVPRGRARPRGRPAWC